MALDTGSKLGGYEILAPSGSGGMGGDLRDRVARRPHDYSHTMPSLSLSRM